VRIVIFANSSPNDARGAGAERRADGEFAGASGRTREQEIPDICAGDQENKTNCAQQHEQDSPNVADYVRLQRDERDSHAFVGFRIGRSQILRDGVHVRARLRERDSGLQAADRIQTHADAAVEKRWICPLTDGHINVRRTDPRNACPGNAYDRVGFSVQGDTFAENLLRGSKFALPQSITENRHRTRAGAVFFRAEIAAQQGIEAEGGKKFHGDHMRVHALRLA